MSEPQAAITLIGKARARIDGPLKVTGTARYASDHNLAGHALCRAGRRDDRQRKDNGHRYVARPANAGRARHLQARRSRSDASHQAGFSAFASCWTSRGRRSTTTLFAITASTSRSRSPIRSKQAKAAADAVAVSYAAETPNVDPHLVAKKTKVASKRGNAAKAYAGAPVTIDARYAISPETHNPIETHATVATWDGDELTLYETSQGVVNHRNVLADMLGLPRHKVRVIAKFIGSGFGGKLWPWSQSPLAAAAAIKLGRPVKLVLSRPMMFHAVGHRPRIEQRIRLGARRDGKPRVAAARLREYDVDSRQLRRELRRGHAAYVQRRQSAGDLRPGQAQHRHADLDARSGRGARTVRHRVRDGRTGGQARHRSRRAASDQRAAGSTRAWAFRSPRVISRSA